MIVTQRISPKTDRNVKRCGETAILKNASSPGSFYILPDFVTEPRSETSGEKASVRLK
jgi:hypothetical protein